MTKFSWRRESSLTTSGSLKMDSCLVLTECFSRRFRTSAIDLIHTERVSTSTFSFFAQRLAYSSHAYMIMPQFWCHKYETDSLYFWSLLKRYLSFILRTILRSPVTIWPHGAYRNCESELQGGGPVKDPKLESRVAVSLLNNWRFWKQQNRFSYRKCMATPWMKVRRDFILDGRLIQNVANIQRFNELWWIWYSETGGSLFL